MEKAFGANTQQAREILDVSDETGMLCTEAIWTRYMPSRGMIDDIIASGVIGEVQAIDANLCYPTTAKARITDPALAGGALLGRRRVSNQFHRHDHAYAPSHVLNRRCNRMKTGVDAHNSMTSITRMV